MRNRFISAVLTAFVGSGATAQVQLIATVTIPGDARDKSGLPHTSQTCPPDRFGGFGSAIAATSTPNRYIALTDRGPFDGAAAFRCRFHTLDLVLNAGPDGRYTLTPTLVSTTLLTSTSGKPLMGNTGAYSLRDPAESLRYDPEGVRVSAQGTLYISDEYGPTIDEFSIHGTLLRRFQVPAAFGVTAPVGDPLAEASLNTAGRQPNRGFEGLALTPDGTRLVAILQSPLIQDGGSNRQGQPRTGLNIRMLELTIATGATRQFVYTLDHPSHGVNEILAIGNHEFLVLQRDGKAGSQAKRRALYRVDLRDASDVSNVASLPNGPLPADIRPVKKTLFLDFMDPSLTLTGEHMPEKIEGLCFGPDLPDARRTLLVTIDNDLKAEVPSIVWCFAFTPADLGKAGTPQ
jgi:hypothetical protein